MNTTTTTLTAANVNAALRTAIEMTNKDDERISFNERCATVSTVYAVCRYMDGTFAGDLAAFKGALRRLAAAGQVVIAKIDMPQLLDAAEYEASCIPEMGERMGFVALF